MQRDFAILALLIANLAACATVRTPGPSAMAAIADPSGRPVARATLRQTGAGLALHVEASGLAPGTYGIHLHAVGRCEAPAFASAGPHWNPTGRRHGRDNPAGMHLGDLPNLIVGAAGTGALDFNVPEAVLSGAGPNALLDVDGAAIVVHAQPDDYRTDPSGNSGARIACGVVTAA